ncbi:MAG TPA: MFS transporter, partial [Hellea balneolensis]|nr:MFS transporter [Hellea balneolensis]
MNPVQKMTRPEKQGVLTAILCTGLIAMAWGLQAPLIAQWLERMTGSGALLGTLIALAAVATITLPPFVPKLMSWYDPKKVLLASLLLGALTIPALKIFMFPAAWLAIKFISSALFTIVFVIAEVWINQLAPEHLRGRILGAYGAALAGGMGLGSGLAVWTGIDGWMPFVVCTLIYLIAALPFLVFPRTAPIRGNHKENTRFSLLLSIMKAAPAIMMCAIVFGAIEQIYIYFLPVYDTRLGHTEAMG